MEAANTMAGKKFTGSLFGITSPAKNQPKYYFGESMGAKLVGSKLRVGATGSALVDGLGILKDTIIEGHYTQKQRQQALSDEVKMGSLKYGLGIDEDAEVVTTPETFPKYSKTGPGFVKLIING